MSYWLRTTLTWLGVSAAVFLTSFALHTSGFQTASSTAAGIAGMILFACAMLMVTGAIISILRADARGNRHERRHRRKRRRRRP